MNNPKFQIFESTSNHQFYFRLRAVNGEIILKSEGYLNKNGCEAGIASVRVNAPFDVRYDRRDFAQHYTFNLMAANHQVIGVSEIYTTRNAREDGISSVKQNAPSAPIEDLTL
jgi:uncharacterized protein